MPAPLAYRPGLHDQQQRGLAGHDAEAISATDPLTRSQFCAGLSESLDTIAANLRARRARFAPPLTPGDPSHD